MKITKTDDAKMEETEETEKEGDAEMVEDLVVTAVNEAINKGREEMQAEMGKMTKGLGLPPGMM